MDLSSRILLDSPLVLVSPGMKSRNGSRDSEEDPVFVCQHSILSSQHIPTPRLHSHIHVHHTARPKRVKQTHHSKAANTHPAMLLLQTPLLRPALLPHRASPNKSASAMKPANQKIMVTASRPRMAHLCANCWNFMGATMR